MKKQLIYSLLTCVIFTSCKKNELPKNEEEAGTPVFYFKCNVNGVPVKIEAGINTYAMTAGHFQDKNNLYVYESQLKQSNCTSDCGIAVAIQFNDVMLRSAGAPQKVDSALSIGAHPFNLGNSIPVFYKGVFNALKADDDATYLWTFSHDGSTATSREVTKIFRGPNNCTVKLDYDRASGGGSETLTKQFKVGNPVQAYINGTFDGTTLKHRFTSSTDGDGVKYQYIWDFGDNTAHSYSPQPDHTYVGSPLNSNITLTLVNASNDTCVTRYQVRDTTSPNANYTSNFTPFLNPAVASAITLVYTDQNGLSSSTATGNQPLTSKIEIVSVENYKNNDKGEPTKKVKIRFNCTLPGASGPINLTDGEAVIAVSYK